MQARTILILAVAALAVPVPSQAFDDAIHRQLTPVDTTEPGDSAFLGQAVLLGTNNEHAELDDFADEGHG